MKKYHIADALTLCEVLAGIAILIATALHIPASIVIWFFVFGELCDAFDGPCARRWKYPDDGKPRWWRTYVKEIEHLSDIFIAIACMIYLMYQPDDITYSLPSFLANGPVLVSESARLLGIFIIVICGAVEVEVQSIKGTMKSDPTPLIKPIILVRRFIYAFIGIGGGIFLLIMATSWHIYVKYSLILFGIAAGLALLCYKFDRASNI